MAALNFRRREKTSIGLGLMALGRLVFTAALVVWAFILGVLVGQGVLVTPDQIDWVSKKTGLGALLAEHEPGRPQEDLTKVQLSFYESLAGEKVGQHPPPAATPAPPKGAATPPAATAEDYAVQVASFREKAQAQDLAQRLTSGGHPAFILEADVSGLGSRYRVRVGPFKSKQDAQMATDSIRARHNLAGLVVKGQ